MALGLPAAEAPYQAAAAAEPCGVEPGGELRLSDMNPVVSPGVSPAASLDQALQSNAPVQHTTPQVLSKADVWPTSVSEPEMPDLTLCASPQVSTQGLGAGQLTRSQHEPNPTVEAYGQQRHVRPDGSPITRGDVSKAAPRPPQQQRPRAAQHKANKQQPALPRAAGPSKPPASAAAKTARQPSLQGTKIKVVDPKPRWNASTRVSQRGPR